MAEDAGRTGGGATAPCRLNAPAVASVWRVPRGRVLRVFPQGLRGAGSPRRSGLGRCDHHRGTAGDRACLSEGEAAASYRSGFLALREGPSLERAVRALPEIPDVLLVDATGRDHPRRAGLALHLGARLDVPSIGVTDRTLMAEGAWPPDEPGATSPLRLGAEVVGFWVRTVPGARPLAVHAACRTDPQSAVEVVRAVTAGVRTPEPLRLARRIARQERARQRPTPI